MIGETPLPIVGPGMAMRALAARAAELQRDVTRPVMLVGPRGLGKQFLAQRIHQASSLSAQPIAVLDARGVTDDAIRSALNDAAANTTLLIRHVEQLTIPAQRLLDERTRTRNSVARVMATSTGDVVARVTAGLFLE